jgi:predicted HTH domain antitoxin
MSFAIDLPENIVSHLQKRWGNLPRRALEAVAVEAYRDEALSLAEARQLLGHASRWETEAFLKAKQAFLHYSEDDLERDTDILRKRSTR